MNELTRLIQAIGYAFQGLIYLLKEQKHTKLLLAIAALSLLICPLIGFSAFQTIIVFFSVMVAVVAEIINTAIEITLDLQVEGKFHPKVKIAKDVAACAVLICAINSFIITLVIFVSNIFIY